MYGTYAKSGWRYTDGHLICSAAITNSGQRLDQESIDFVNKKLNTELNTDKNYIKLADTDSMYIELKDVIDTKYGLSLSKEERNQKILELAQEIQDAANANLDNISKDLFNIKPGTHYFQLKQEVICTGLLTTGKRRYAMYVTNKEGVPVEELDMKGLELMKIGRAHV